MKGKTQQHQVAFYNLDMIISVGYRVHSYRGVQFRIWATKVLKEFIVKGFALNDLVSQDIRSSENRKEFWEGRSKNYQAFCSAYSQKIS